MKRSLKSNVWRDEKSNANGENTYVLILPAFFPTSIPMKPPLKYIIICCLGIWLIWTISLAITASTNYISATCT